jgi:hypothetical protein
VGVDNATLRELPENAPMHVRQGRWPLHSVPLLIEQARRRDMRNPAALARRSGSETARTVSGGAGPAGHPRPRAGCFGMVVLLGAGGGCLPGTPDPMPRRPRR